MSTVRMARRWIYMRRRRVYVDRRELLTVALVGTAIFAAFFALGRISSPTSVPLEQGPRHAPIESAGAAIPASLGVAPAIVLDRPRPARRPASLSSRAPSAVSSRVSSGVVVPSESSSAPAVVTHQPSAVAAPTVSPAPAPASAPQTAPAPSAGSGHSGGGSGGGSQSKAGTSFDTSG